MYNIVDDKITTNFKMEVDQIFGNDCNISFNKEQMNHLLMAKTSLSIISSVMCLIAILLVLCLRLYKYFVYRLALYQVVACFVYSMAEILQLVDINYTGNTLQDATCKAVASLLQYLVWMTLLFTMCLVFHIFCLAVCLKNLEKQEKVYVLVSVLLPLLQFWIPFVNDSYGLVGAWCWIRNWKDDCPSNRYAAGIIEQFTLWYGPLLISLTLCLIAVIVIALVLIWRAFLSQKMEVEPLIKGNRNKAVLKQLLPLLAYPIIFFLLALLPLISRLYNIISPDGYNLFLDHAFTETTWGFFSALALIVHVLLLRKPRLQKEESAGTHRKTEGNTAVYTRYTVASTNAVSEYHMPRESEFEAMHANSK